MTTTYTVWRRLDDGYVGASARSRAWSGGANFEVLLTTEDWPEARRRIAVERLAAGQDPLYETGNGLPVATGRFRCERCEEVYP